MSEFKMPEKGNGDGGVSLSKGGEMRCDEFIGRMWVKGIKIYFKSRKGSNCFQ